MKQDKINDLITRGVIDTIVRESLIAKLKSGKKLRIKLGIDPTGKKLHLGNAIPILKLRDFQELGHHIVFIIGDFTGQLGDASDKESSRPMLTESQIIDNMKLYKKQISNILDLDKIEVRYNSEWHNNLTQKEVIRLASLFTVAQMIERESFTKRFKAGKPIGLHELLYPQLQGYDSVMVRADIEVGGKDQLFNLLAGRDVQIFYKQKPQDILTFDLLEGTDGRKMSMTYNNFIAVDEAPKEMYGKAMSIKDDLIMKYFTLVTRVPMPEIKEIGNALKNGSNPRDAKARLAFELVKLFHNEKEAVKAENEFKNVFQNKALPKDIPTVKIKGKINNYLDLLLAAKLVVSKAEARRLVEQGGVKINQKAVKDWKTKPDLSKKMIIQVGKRKFARII